MLNKRAAILDATLSLLASKGFHGFSIKDVAREAGVATGTLYLYFADRDDLIEQLYRQIVDKVAEVIVIAPESGQNLQQEFRSMCFRFYQLFQQQPAILLSKTQFDHLPSEVLFKRHADAKVALHGLFDFFARGRQQRILKDLPDDVLFALGFDPYFEIVRKTMLGLLETDETLLDAIVTASWDAIACRE